MEMTALYIPHIIERENDEFEYEDLTITQNGILVRWTFVAREIGEGEEYPHLNIIIPALTGNVFTVKKIENINCTENPYPNVYECSVTPEPVEAEDSIGIVLPAYDSARLLLSFLSVDGGPIGQSLDGNENLEGVPLITLGVGKSSLAALNIVYTMTFILSQFPTRAPWQHLLVWYVALSSYHLQTTLSLIPQPTSTSSKTFTTIISDSPSPTTGISVQSVSHECLNFNLQKTVVV